MLSNRKYITNLNEFLFLFSVERSLQLRHVRHAFQGGGPAQPEGRTGLPQLHPETRRIERRLRHAQGLPGPRTQRRSFPQVEGSSLKLEPTCH